MYVTLTNMSMSHTFFVNVAYVNCVVTILSIQLQKTSRVYIVIANTDHNYVLNFNLII
jgi:hypothetical protein